MTGTPVISEGTPTILGTPILPATPTQSPNMPGTLGTPILLEAPTLLGTPNTPATPTSVKRLGVLLARDLPCAGTHSEAGRALVDPDPADGERGGAEGVVTVQRERGTVCEGDRECAIEFFFCVCVCVCVWRGTSPARGRVLRRAAPWPTLTLHPAPRVLKPEP